jgi:beta-glucosidase
LATNSEVEAVVEGDATTTIRNLGYLDVQLPISERIELLLAQMTLEEKVNQLLIPEVSESLQEFFINNSRLGIPVSFVQEGLHSGAAGGTIYPMPCGMATTWNPSLVQKVHEAIAMEVRTTFGGDRTFSPNINLYSDPRFDRIQEGFGEDPYLVSLFSMAAIQGLQGLDSTANLDSYLDNDHIASNAKHFAAYGRTTGGQDGTAADLSERTLREIYLKPFQAAVSVNVKALMPAHEELNGIPCHANTWLLTNLLRNEWGWVDGLLSSDYGDIGGLVGYHMATNFEGAALLAINAGVDMDLGEYSYPSLLNLTSSVSFKRMFWIEQYAML